MCVVLLDTLFETNDGMESSDSEVLVGCIVFKAIRRGETRRHPRFQLPRRNVRRGKATLYHWEMHGKGEKEREKE
jgi:hypothetical protein